MAGSVEGTHLGLQLLLLPADLFLCLLIELSHLVEVVRVSPAWAGGAGSPSELHNSMPGVLLPPLPSAIIGPCHVTLGLWSWSYLYCCPDPSPIYCPHCPKP